MAEQSQRTRAHFERILLVCGEQNSGKSRLLRHMLSDENLGGVLPAGPRVGLRALSRDRCLAVRFTSPHETNETPQIFHRKIDRASEMAWKRYGRINYATAVQPRPFRRMPGIVEVCAGLQREFRPERIRVVYLRPDQRGRVDGGLSCGEIDGLRRLNLEVISIDARRSDHAADPGNVRLLADFFDFT